MRVKPVIPKRAGGKALEWVKVLGPLLISWPTVVLVVVCIFNPTILKLIERFTDSAGSKAELGPIKIELGNPVLPPQYRAKSEEKTPEGIDLAADIGAIRDTGPEGATVGFSLAYAIQAAIKQKSGESVQVSPRGIYELAKLHDEWPGANYEGTSSLGALKAAKAEGVFLEKDWPYASKVRPQTARRPLLKISGFSQLKGIAQVLNALREKKVIVASIQVTEDFDKTDSHGRVIVKLPLKVMGLKTISIVGYDETSAEFKFANDWGTGWGKDGFGLVKDTDLARIMESAYSVEL